MVGFSPYLNSTHLFDDKANQILVPTNLVNCQRGPDNVLRGGEVSRIIAAQEVQSDGDPLPGLEGEDGGDGAGGGEVCLAGRGGLTGDDWLSAGSAHTLLAL